jgi:hypothetical protein
MRKFVRWASRFSLSMMLFWWWMIAVVMGGCAFLMTHNAYAEDDTHVIKRPMYVNWPDETGNNKDNLRIDYDGIWEGFGPEVKVPGAEMLWAFVDYQRNIGGVRVDITTKDGTFPTCPMFEVNDVEYLRTLNDPRLKVFNTFMTTCEGVEKWIKEELKD